MALRFYIPFFAYTILLFAVMRWYTTQGWHLNRGGVGSLALKCLPARHCPAPVAVAAAARNLSEAFAQPAQRSLLRSRGHFFAVCRLPQEAGRAALLQLCGCWSWWQAQPGSAPVLIDTAGLGRSKLPLVAGLLEAWEALGVKVVASFPEVEHAVVATPKVAAGSWLMEAGHARSLREGVAGHLGLPTAEPERIGLLFNRGRRFDVMDLLRGLGELAPTDLSRLEDASFRKQVAFMSSHGVVVSLQGAGLGALTFMPSCGSVLELYRAADQRPGDQALAAVRSRDLAHLSLTQEGPGGQGLCLAVHCVLDVVRALLAGRQKCLEQR